jgi:hypothetical protein
LPQNYWHYPGAVRTTWKGVGFQFDNRSAFQLLQTCDLIFSVETFYDLRLAQQNIPMVLYVNPELFRGYGSPTYWAPTDWLVDQLPEGTRVVPFPVATDRPYRKGTGFLHVAGRNAAYDRNGTRPAAAAVRRLGEPLKLAHQIDMPSVRGTRRMGATEHYWDLYAAGGTLVMPRRYGGMCLPVQEALAAGLNVVMTDIEPNSRWPVMRIPGKRTQVKTVANFPIPAIDVDVEALTEGLRNIEEWAIENEPARVAWVEANSWDTLTPMWRQALEDAAK